MIHFLKNALKGDLYLTGRPMQGQHRMPSFRSIPKSLFGLAVIASLCVFCPVSSAQDDDDYGDEYDDDMDMNMDMEDDYGDGGYGGGYGSGSSRRGGSVQDLFAAQLQDSLTSTFESSNILSLTDPGAAPPVQAGPVLINDALVAYAKGDLPLAMRLYFGHMVAEYDSASGAFNQVKYSPIMKRPVWQVRWGISYAIRGEATDPQPIEDVAARARGGMNGGGYDEQGMDDDYGDEIGGGGRGGRGGRNDGGDYPDDEYGDDMDEEMDMEMGMEDYEDDYGSSDGSGRRRQAAPAGPPTPVARLAALERTMLSEEANQDLVDTIGVVAMVLGEQFDQRYAQGDFGRAMTDASPESGNIETVSEGFVDLVENTTESLPLWRPGMIYLGQGFSADTTALGKKAGLDLLLHVDVLLKPFNSGFVQNKCICSIIHLPTGKVLGRSKAIDSVEFTQKSRSRGLASREYVDEKLTNFFSIMDKQTVASEMPSLTPEIAKRRIGMLLASGGGKNLRTLAEVRLFQSQNLLNEDEVLTAFDIVGGEEAMKLLYGSEKERLDTVRKWAGSPAGEAE
jgi:hypothetical protein